MAFELASGGEEGWNLGGGILLDNNRSKPCGGRIMAPSGNRRQTSRAENKAEKVGELGQEWWTKLHRVAQRVTVIIRVSPQEK